MKSSDELFDTDSLLTDLAEIIDESPTAALTASASQLFLNWPTGNDVLVTPGADWPAIRPPEVAGQQPETEIATWSGAIGNDVTVALRDYTDAFSAATVTNNPATWAVFETEPATSLKSVCLLPPEGFDVKHQISAPCFGTPPAAGNHGDDVVMTKQATQGIFLHNADHCDTLAPSIDVSTSALDPGCILDIQSTPSTILTLNPSGVWLIAPGGPSQTVAAPEVIQASNPALPLNVAQPLSGSTSEMEFSLEDVGSGGKRLWSRCLSDSEVLLTGKASPLLARQGSKRQRKGPTTTRAPGVRGRSTSEAGTSRTMNTEDPDVDEFRLLRRREQNRRAARNCRERKREMSASMVKEYQELLSSNTNLRFEIRQLQQEEQSLQTVLEKHLTICTSMTSSPLTSSTLPSSTSHANRTLTSDDPMASEAET